MCGQCNVRPTSTLPVIQHHCCLASAKLYCLVTEVDVHEQLVQGRYTRWNEVAGIKPGCECVQTWDVATVLRSLREQRMYLVQTVTQFSYVYRVLVSYLQSSRLI